MVKSASHTSVVVEVIVIRLPSVPVTMTEFAAPVKLNVEPASNCIVLAAPIAVTLKLKKVEDPVIVAVAVVASTVVCEPLAVNVPLLVKLPFKVYVPEVGASVQEEPLVSKPLTVKLVLAVTSVEEQEVVKL